MILVNCFHLVNMLYLSMFTFCRDLGAFARKLSEGYFGHISGKLYHIGIFSKLEKLEIICKWKRKKSEKVRKERKVRRQRGK